MKYILTSSKEIFITYILNFLIIFISSLIYTLLGYTNLNTFINSTCIYILIIFYILTFIYLYKKYYHKEITLPTKEYFPLISLGISTATLLNMLIFLINPPHSIITISPLLAIISSGIVGPIYEEILFRYILYNRLKKKYSIKKSIILTTTIFALTHLSPIKMIYAFILGLIINITYEKRKNILAPILMHISANIIVIFLYEYNTYILLLSIINLLLCILHNVKCRKDIVKKNNS